MNRLRESFEDAFDNILILIGIIFLAILYLICFVIEVLIFLLPYLIIGFILLKIFS